MTEALIAFAAMLLLAFARLPIAFAMGLVGFAGFALKTNVPAALAMTGALTYETGLSYALSIVPLFVLMGNLVTRAGLSEELYKASHAFLGHRRGGLAMATIVACGGFSADLGLVGRHGRHHGQGGGAADAALRLLRRARLRLGRRRRHARHPDPALGGDGHLRHPDRSRTSASCSSPASCRGCSRSLCYIGAIIVTVAFRPCVRPAGETRCPWSSAFERLRGVWGVLLLFGMVLGGIYGGVFTPTEAAGIGAAGAFLFAIGRCGWDMADAARGAGGERGDHRDDLQHPDRRADLRQLRQPDDACRGN